MKRTSATKRLPGGAIVRADHHGSHDQKTHGNREGGAEREDEAEKLPRGFERANVVMVDDTIMVDNPNNLHHGRKGRAIGETAKGKVRVMFDDGRIAAVSLRDLLRRKL